MAAEPASIRRVLRPFSGFEAVYQGADADIPIAFPGTLDLEAGKPGYDPTLIKFMPVPFNARLVLWIPLTLSVTGEGATPPRPYRYQICWRLRNIEESNESVAAQFPPAEQLRYSEPAREFGATYNGAQRVIVPCAMETIVFRQTEPGTGFTNGTENLRGNFIVPNGEVTPDTPLMPPPAAPMTEGALGQGIFDQASSNASIGPTYMTYETIVAGDEFAILARRETVLGGDVWDFTLANEDLTFSDTYGTGNGTHPEIPGLGIFVLTAPR
jgi:hypothetical protein